MLLLEEGFLDHVVAARCDCRLRSPLRPYSMASDVKADHRELAVAAAQAPKLRCAGEFAI